MFTHHDVISTHSGLSLRPRWDMMYEARPIGMYSKAFEDALRDNAPKSAFIPERKNPERKPVMNAQMRNKVQARRNKKRSAKKTKRTNR